LLCEIAPEILSKFPDYKILIIGDGNDFESVQRAKDKANAILGYEAVILKGKSTEVEKECARAKIFVGVSRAAIEAMSCECAVVLCGNEGYSGILEKEIFQKALLTNLCARDSGKATSEQLKYDLAKLLSDESYTAKLRKDMRELVKCYLSRENMANDLVVAYERLMESKRTQKALIVGYFGQRNMGDEATLTLLKERLTGPEFVLPHAVLYAKSDDMDLLELSKILNRKLFECNTVIFGGGNLLQNETSNRSLLYYLEILRRAKRGKKRILLLSSGIGQITGQIARGRCKIALMGCDFVGLRTYGDIELYKSLTGKDNAIFMPDVCFYLERALEKPSEEYILYIPRLYDRTMIEQIKEKSMLLGKKIVVMVMFKKKDEAEAVRIANELIAELKCPTEYKEALFIIANAAFVITDRLHGAVFAITQNREVFLRTESEKCLFLYETIKKIADNLSISCPIRLYSEINTKKIGAANDSDFEKLLSFLRNQINSALLGLENCFD
jgi:polysaccharide pyruvyl transferase WcaK-like protein